MSWWRRPTRWLPCCRCFSMSWWRQHELVRAALLGHCPTRPASPLEALSTLGNSSASQERRGADDRAALRCVGRAAPSSRRPSFGLHRRHRACCWRSPGGGCRNARSPACLLLVHQRQSAPPSPAAASVRLGWDARLVRLGDRTGYEDRNGDGRRSKSRNKESRGSARPSTRSDAGPLLRAAPPATGGPPPAEQQPMGSTLRSRRGAGCCPSFLHSVQLTTAARGAMCVALPASAVGLGHSTLSVPHLVRSGKSSSVARR